MCIVTTVSLDHVAVHALDAATGTKQWSFPVNDGWLHNSPTIYDGAVYLSSGRQQLAAVALNDGSVRWRAPTQADDTRPVVDAYRGLVYVGHPRGVEAFDLNDDGTRVWDFVTTEPGTANEDFLGVLDEPVVLPDQVAVRTHDTSDSSLGDVGNCYGVDPETGSKVWKLSGGRPASSIIGAGGQIILRRAESTADIDFISGVEPGTGSLVAVQPDGSVAWERQGLWKPLSVGTNRLLAYRSSLSTRSGGFEIASFSA